MSSCSLFKKFNYIKNQQENIASEFKMSQETKNYEDCQGRN